MKESLRLLVVDDELSLLTPLAKRLRQKYGYQVDTASDAMAALEQLEQVQGNYHVALIDDLLVPKAGYEPEPLGVILTKKIKARYPGIEIIVFTGWGLESALETLRAGAYRYLAKPLNYDELDILIQSAAEQSRLKGVAREKKILERLMATSAALLDGEDLDETLDIILQGIRSIGFDRVRLYLLSDDDREMRGIAEAGMDAEFAGFTFKLLEDEYMQKLMDNPRPQIFERDGGKPMPYEKELAKEGVDQWVCVPLVVEGKIIGKLSMDNKFSRRPIAEGELGPIDLFVSQAATAIQKARLRDKELAARRQAEKRARNLEVIQHVLTTLSSTLEPRLILKLVCRAAVDLIEADHSGLVIFEEPHCEFGRVEAEYPDIGTQGAKIQVQGVPLEEKLITDKTPVVMREITETAALGPVGDVFDRFDIQSILIVPVILKDQVIGSFSLDSIGRRRDFGREEIDLCRTFADHVAIAVGNARTYEAVKHYAERLDVLYKISDYIQASEDLDKILHVVLTGVTAGYGLGFNRAALLLLDEWGACLVGRMGVGHLKEAKARADWKQDRENKCNFASYLAALEGNGLTPTPLDARIRKLQLPINGTENDIFSCTLRKGKHLLLTEDGSQKIPAEFADAFDPGLPLIVMPLLARDQPIGLLVADNKFTKAGVSNKDVEAFSTFANTAAIAIDNTRLLHETRVATEQLSSFFEASNALISSHNPEAVLQDILQMTCAATQANSVSLVLIDSMGQAQYLKSVGQDDEIEVDSYVVRSNGLSMKVMLNGRFEVIENTKKEKGRVNPCWFQRGVQAALCLPVSLKDKRIGVMWLHYLQPRRFAEAEIKALQLYVNQAAIAFDSARRMKELDYMRRAAEALAGADNLENVLEQIVQSAQVVMQADSAVILPYDAGRNRFIQEKAVAVGISLAPWDLFQKVEPRQGGTAHTIMEQEWIGIKNVADRQEYGFLGKTTRSFLKNIQAQSFQGVALRIGEELFGVLYVNFENQRTFSNKEQETARIFANHAALALKNARLLEQLSETRNAAREVAEATVLGDLNRTLRAIVKKSQDVLHADVVTLYTYDQTTATFGFPPVMVGVENTSALVEPDRTSQSTIRKILALDGIHIAENRTADPVMNDTFATEEGIQSSAGVPLRVKAFEVGVMVVSYKNKHHFIDDELQNIKLFANQAAVAIRNAQLFERLEKRVRIHEALHEAGRALSSTLDPKQLLSVIVQQAWKLTGASNSSHIAALRDNKLVFIAAYPHDRLEQVRRTIGEIDLNRDQAIGIMGVTAKTKTSQLVNNVNSCRHYLRYNSETRSEIAVPIMSGRKVDGVIDVEHHQQDAFDQEHLHALEALAAQAGVALQNANLFEDTQRKAYLLNMAARVARQATAILDIDELLGETARLIADNFGFYHTGVFLFGAEDDTVALKVVYPENDARLSTGHKLKLGQGIVGTVAQSGEAYLAPDVSRDPHYIPNLPLTRAEMAFPLMAGGKVIGVLDAQSKAVGDWQSEDIATLQTMADQLANAISNAGLYQQMNERLAESDVLRNVAVLLAGTSKLSGILEVVLLEAMRLTNTHEGLVLFWDSEAGGFKQGFKVDLHHGLQYYQPQTRANGLSQRVIEERVPVCINDTKQSSEINPRLVQQGCRATLGVPLFSPGHDIGVLYVRSQQPEQFSDGQVRLLEILAGQVAMAIDRARQYEEMRKIKGFIGSHTAMDWIRMVSTTWGHSIKREVGTARGHVALLRTLLPEEQLAADIRQQLDQLDQVINGIKAIPVTAPLSYEDGITSVKINATLKTYLERRWRQDRYRSVGLELKLQPRLDARATVRASQEWLRRGLELIIDNAVSAMEEAGSAHQQITITTQLLDQTIEIYIQDTGPGIPEDVQRKLFNQPILKAEGSKGSGIGLMLARTIFQTYLGEVKMKTTGQQGTIMQVTLPVEPVLNPIREVRAL